MTDATVDTERKPTFALIGADTDRCCSCLRVLPTSEFVRARRRACGYIRRCRACERQREALRRAQPGYKEKMARAQKSWAERNPEKAKESRKRAIAKYRKKNTEKTKRDHRRATLRRLYGMTEAEYDFLFSLQGGVCAICKEPGRKIRLHVDHDHRTGKNRGLLCRECNRALGYFHDSARNLDAASEYLKRHA